MADPLPVPPTEIAAAWGLIAMARAVEDGLARGLTREEIAADAHAAAGEAYEAHLNENQPIVGVAARQAPRGHSPLPPHHRKRAKKPTRTTVMPQPEFRVHVGHQHGSGHGGGGHHGGHHHEHAFFDEPDLDYELACPPDQLLLADGTCAPWPVVGASVGHGHGGGGHHHHHGGHGFGGVIFDESWPVVLACAPGQLLLADGTCFDPAAYGLPVSPAAHIGQVFPVDEDGYITLPDGSAVHMESLAWEFGDESHVGASTVQSQTGLTGAAYVQQLGQNLDNQWQQLSAAGAQAVQDGKLSPTTWGQFQTDYQQWETWYQQAKQADQTSLFGGYGYNGLWYNSATLNDFTAKVSSWYNVFQKADPAAVAANVHLPSPTPDTSALGVLSAAAQAAVTAIEYAVIAVAIGVGVWLLWPVLTAGAAKAAAAL